MNRQHIVEVPATEKSAYPIYVGSGFMERLFAHIAEYYADRIPFIVTDKNLQNAGHLDSLLNGNNVGMYIIDPPGEVSKTITTAEKIIEKMEAESLGRDAIVIALGGGTVGDIAGFAAAIFKRGVPIVQIPTTTVAQADSAIGGKTGVDSAQSKNAFGAFHYPSAVYIDTAALNTLDERQYKAGLVESLKHALIADADYFAFFENHIDQILARDTEALEKITDKNCTIKASVVAADPTEKNLRKILNYGHTIGHAIETASDFELLHGEAVALGMIAAASIEIHLALANDNRLERIAELLNKLDQPAKIPADIEPQKLLEIMQKDKKALAKTPRFVLLDQIGKVHTTQNEFTCEVDPKIISKVLKQISS